MGIKGLLDKLSHAQEPITEDQLKRRLGGKVAGIDGHGWLHRAIHTCGDRIALSEEGARESFVNVFFSLIHLVLQIKLMPVIVFDGMDLPAKRDTDLSRRL